MLLRQEEVPDVVVDDNLSLHSTEMDSTWVSFHIRIRDLRGGITKQNKPRVSNNLGLG